MSLTINGKTEIYGLIGHPITHSLSPKIHNFLFDFYKINAVYICFNAKFEKKNTLKKFLECLKEVENIKGLNVTIPYKEWVCDITENDYKFLKSVNCLKFVKKEIFSTNTDIYGFKEAIYKDLEMDLINKKVMVYGAGATAKSIIYAIINEVDKVFVYNRTFKNAKKLKRFFNKYSPKIELTSIISPNFLKEVDLIINATPVGLNNEMFNIDFEKVKKDCCFFDVIYLDTPFIKKAKKNGFRAINGLSMLIYQAVKSFEYWTNKKVNGDTIKKIFRILQ